ncbi:MAG: hypothetical protein ACREBW_07050 [Candidatus Micrarchaeaceae archaeon]
MEIKIFNNDAKWLRTLAAACAVAGAASSIASFFIGVIFAIPLCALSLGILAFLARRLPSNAASLNHSTLRFASNLIENWSGSTGTSRIIESSLDDGFAFSGSLRTALVEYRHAGDATSAFRDASSRYPVLGRILGILALRLDTGIDVRDQLELARAELQSSHDRGLRGLGASSNAAAVSGAGAVLFFPAFAGISLGIIRAASVSGQQAALHSGLTVIFAGYILITVAIGSLHSQGTAASKLAKTSALSSLAFLILMLSSTLQIGAI